MASPYPQTLVASDNFQRANENPLSNGGKWSALTGTVQPLQVVGNALECTTTGVGAGCSAYWSGNSFNANQFATAVVGTSTVATNNGGVLLRVQTGAAQQSCYTVQYVGITGQSCTILITVINNNAETVLIQSTMTINTGDVILGEVFGNQINMYVNGVLKLSALDATWTVGPPGVHLNVPVSGSIASITAGAWTAGNLSSSSAGSTPYRAGSSAATLINQASPASLAFGVNVVVGDLLICSGRCGASPVTVTDTQGNTWIPIVTDAWKASNFYFLYYAIAKSSGPNTVTVTQASGNITFCLAAYNTATTLDQFAVADTGAAGTWTSALSGILTPTKPNELIIVGLGEGTITATPTAGGPLTLRANAPVASILDLYQANTGSLEGGGLYGSAVSGVAAIASFLTTASTPQSTGGFGYDFNFKL